MDVDLDSAEVSVSSEIPVIVYVLSETPITESTPQVIVVIGSSFVVVRDEPCSSSGKRPEEHLKMSFVDDSSEMMSLSVLES
ncbi:hypothetical protein Hanom_Chr15g01338081 [Helianthus anomalus]